MALRTNYERNRKIHGTAELIHELKKGHKQGNSLPCMHAVVPMVCPACMQESNLIHAVLRLIEHDKCVALRYEDDEDR